MPHGGGSERRGGTDAEFRTESFGWEPLGHARSTTTKGELVVVRSDVVPKLVLSLSQT